MRISFSLAVMVVGSCLATSIANAACVVSDIRIKNWNWHVDSGYDIVVGELVNGCPEPTGVQLQVVFRDASGNAVDTDEFWPASTNNIAANRSYVFKWTSEWNPQGKSATLSVIALQQW